MESFLLKGLAAGSAEAYQQTYNRYGDVLFATALRILGNRADAEDAVQDVFASLVRSRRSLKKVKNFKAYMFISLRNSAARIIQHQKRTEKFTAERLSQLTGEHHRYNNNYTYGDFDAEKLWRCVDCLPAPQREILALKIQGELSFREIACVCDISANTAASRYRYALEKLRNLLEQGK